MEYFWIGICSFLASLITFYSGFGLATILMPVIAIFFPLPVAIGLTAIVHLFHSMLRTGILWKAIDWGVAIRFGGMALIAAIPGAWLLKQLALITPIKKYSIFSMSAELSILHILIGLLLIFFATLEMIPNKTFKVKNLFLGGIISGFFGGLSGHQGAFRSIFLINANLGKESFIGTSAIISTGVDIVRLVVYGLSFSALLSSIDLSLLITAIGSGFLGICLGMILLNKITISFIQKVIVILLYLLGILLAIGII